MRFELFEIHDQPWFPDFLRREVVDALQMILERTDAYRPIAGRLRQALSRSGSQEVLDLFSGAGGPWPSLVRLFESEGAPPSKSSLLTSFRMFRLVATAKRFVRREYTFSTFPWMQR